MIDFSKIGAGNTADTVLQPREIFNTLPNKDAHKFQYPRDVQSQVWSRWFDRRDEDNLVIKMNTGGGKTVVGLLILKSCLNEKKFPAAYICPDKYLVQQVIDAAQELGVEVTNDVKSHRFLSGKAVLVTNIYKVVNGLSVFGVGDAGARINLSSVIIDDAHACLDTVEDQFTLDIPFDSEAYKAIYNLFKSSLHSECESKAIEIEAGDSTNYIQVPYWCWQENLSDVYKILVKYKDEDYLKFVWPLIKEQTKLSHCVVSASKIEITPHSIPIYMIPSLIDADRKVFMTATLVDDSILSSHFAVERKNIDTPIIPDSAGDIGDRMILLPQVINPETTDVEIKDYCKLHSKNINVVVIVPSAYRAEFWADDADLILNTENLYQGVEKLKSKHVGLTILINRYDGIDLPGDACRLLVIDGFPDVRKLIDKAKQSVLMGSDRLINQTIQRIEQGMGRGVRSNDDYCAVFLMGRDLTSQLYSQGAMNKLSPGTNAQLVLSEQVTEQIKGSTITELTDTLNYCLSQNSDWVSASKGVLATLKFSQTGQLDDLTIAIRDCYELASKNANKDAANILLQMVNKLADKKEKGFCKQLLAEYINMYDKVEAQKTQLSAISDNRRVLKPIEGIQYNKMESSTHEQAVLCRNFLTDKFQDSNKMLIEVKGLLSKLKFKANSANVFEESFMQIAKYLGFLSQRPEVEFRKGPDVLWEIGNLKYLVIECKNEAYAGTITKTYCNQLNGSCNWFEAKYDKSCSYTPIMVHPSVIFEYASSPKTSIRIITKERLELFCNAVNEFIKAIAVNNSMGNQDFIRESLELYKLRSIDFVELYTEFFKVKNQP